MGLLILSVGIMFITNSLGVARRLQEAGAKYWANKSVLPYDYGKVFSLRFYRRIFGPLIALMGAIVLIVGLAHL
jgi:hypothetical protein